MEYGKLHLNRAKGIKYILWFNDQVVSVDLQFGFAEAYSFEKRSLYNENHVSVTCGWKIVIKYKICTALSYQKTQ